MKYSFSRLWLFSHDEKNFATLLGELDAKAPLNDWITKTFISFD